MNAFLSHVQNRTDKSANWFVIHANPIISSVSSYFQFFPINEKCQLILDGHIYYSPTRVLNIYDKTDKKQGTQLRVVRYLLLISRTEKKKTNSFFTFTVNTGFLTFTSNLSVVEWTLHLMSSSVFVHDSKYKLLYSKI